MIICLVDSLSFRHPTIFIHYSSRFDQENFTNKREGEGTYSSMFPHSLFSPLLCFVKKIVEYFCLIKDSYLDYDLDSCHLISKIPP